MEQYELRQLLESVAEGKITVNEAITKFKAEPFEDLGYAKPDYHRGIRKGFSEIIYGEGKSYEQIIGIASNMIKHKQKTILITRLSYEKYQKIKKEIPLEYNEIARIGIIGEIPEANIGNIVVITGGTSDIPVAEEAVVTAESFGNKVTKIYDVGVAGIHRLLSNSNIIMNAKVIIAIAGMEGALASVVGGLADCPVIAVPTSVGYGAAFRGLAALLSMLNSCASGVSVVNIDNGFGAGYLASMINQIGGKK